MELQFPSKGFSVQKLLCQCESFRVCFGVYKLLCEPQQERLSRFRMSSANRIKRKWHHQARMPRQRKIQHKEFQEMARSTAVTGMRLRSYRPSLVLISFSPFRSFRHPACPGSTRMGKGGLKIAVAFSMRCRECFAVRRSRSAGQQKDG